MLAKDVMSTTVVTVRPHVSRCGMRRTETTSSDLGVAAESRQRLR